MDSRFTPEELRSNRFKVGGVVAALFLMGTGTLSLPSFVNFNAPTVRIADSQTVREREIARAERRAERAERKAAIAAERAARAADRAEELRQKALPAPAPRPAPEPATTDARIDALKIEARAMAERADQLEASGRDQEANALRREVAKKALGLAIDRMADSVN